MPDQSFRFADFELDLGRCELRRAGTLVPIQRKPLDVLVWLVRHQNRVVSKDELLQQVWPGVSVSEHALNSAIRDLRRALGDPELIVTVRGRGYRLTGTGPGLAPGGRAVTMAPAVALSAEPQNVPENEPFVERDEVMLALRASLSAAVNGAPRVSLLSGPAGIGKTRAALELVREARQLGVAVHMARSCGEGDTPFWPWLEVVRSALRGTELGAFPARARSLIKPLVWIAPELIELDSAELRRDIDLLEARYRLFVALTTLFRELCKSRPFLIFVDDLHWGDEASLLFLEFLARNLADVQLHLVAAFRDGDTELDPTLKRVLGSIASQPVSERIDLVGLKRDGIERLLAAAGGRQPAHAMVDKVSKATAGNPFFVSEIARLVRSGQLDAESEQSEVPVPGRVRDAIRLHLKRRSVECVALLEVASVVGREIDLLPLAHAFGDSQARTLELLDEAESAGLLRRMPEQPGAYAFVHDLVRESLYRDLSTSRRTRLHLEMGVALEALEDPERLGEIAYHYGEAAALGVAENAFFYSRRAAEHASSMMAYEDAVAHYERALRVLKLVESTPPEVACEVLLRQAEAAWGTLESAEAVQRRFVRAARAARSIQSASLLARAALGRTGHGAGPGDFRDIAATDLLDIELLTEANRALGPEPSNLKALVLSRLAMAAVHQNPVLARTLSAEAQQMAERLADAETLASVLRYRHEVITGPSSARERLGLAERVLRLARDVGSRSLELDALFFLSRDHFELADLERAAETGQAADALAATMRHPGANFRSGTRKVLILTMLGAFEKALQAARTYFEHDSARNLSAPGTFAAQRVIIHVLREDYRALLRELEEPGHPRTWRLTRFCKAVAWAHVGRLDEARVELESAARDSFRSLPDDHTLLGSVMLLADLCNFFDDSERAEQLYALARPFEHYVAAPLLSTTCQGSVARALGVLAHTTRRYAASEAHFRTAIAVEKKLKSPPLLAQTLARFGRMLIARAQSGDPELAARLFKEAAEIRKRLGYESSIEPPSLADGAAMRSHRPRARPA